VFNPVRSPPSVGDDIAFNRDGMITRFHFHVVPIVFSWECLERGMPHFGFEATLPVYLSVLPRRETRLETSR
jgi:hypothetical protein